MTRSLGTLSALALLLLAAPAAAQVTTRDHRDPKPPDAGRPNHDVVVKMVVTSWAPKAGKPGTAVAIEGKAFSKTTSVLIGGKPVPATITATKITFAIPAVWGNGEIRLRKPSVAEDYVVGTLTVEAPPEIRAVSPVSGPAGTRVEVRGKAFAKGDELRMNGRALPLAEQGDERLVFVLPDWAKTDHLALWRGTAERSRSKKPFTVIAAAPAIASFSPEGGPPGATVRITGQNFGAKDTALYGRRPAEIVGRGAGWVDVKVPGDARQEQRFTIVGEGGQAETAKAYQLDLPAAISDVKPTYGAPGSQVNLLGAAFRAGDQVFLGGKKADIVQLRATQIVAVVPHGTPGGEVVLKRGDVEVKAKDRFEVVNPPSLTGFTPSKGEPGTTVTLTGTWLEGAQVWYGAGRINPSKLDDKSIELSIPAGASAQKFRVKTKGGEATTDKAFEVLEYGLISDAKPRKVPPGGTLTLYGSQLDQIEKVYLNNLELPVALKQDRTTTVTIPANAADGKLGWVSHGRRAETTWGLTILHPPAIAGFQPDSGPPGAQVIVRGSDFDAQTKLFFGEVGMKIVKRGPTELTAEVPAAARGKDHLWVQGDGARVRSTGQFAVMVAPEISVISPAAARPGEKINVRGKFDDATEILIGTWRTTVIKRGDGIIYVTVPETAKPGDWEVTAKSGALTSTYKKKFTVEGVPAPAAAITGFSPKTVEHGGTVTIEGTGFSDACKIKVAGKDLPITKRDPAGTKLWVIVPNTVKGEHWLDLIDGNKRSKSPEKITIVEEKGGVKVRDHRGDKDKPADGGEGGVKVRDHRDGKPAY